jgi:hypothetical protein
MYKTKCEDFSIAKLANNFSYQESTGVYLDVIRFSFFIVECPIITFQSIE